MSRRDALRSYRRAFKRALPEWRDRLSSDLVIEVGRRGDRLRSLFTSMDRDEWPNTVHEAFTTRELRQLAVSDREECDDAFFF